jgi:hypothetical protein
MKPATVLVRPHRLLRIDGELIDRRGIVLLRNNDPPVCRANVASDLTGSERVEQMRFALVVPTPMTREVSLVEKEQGCIVETATEARQAEPGPSILLVLIVSVVSAAAMLGAVWFVFSEPRGATTPTTTDSTKFAEIDDAFSYPMLRQSSFARRPRGPLYGSAWVSALRH